MDVDGEPLVTKTVYDSIEIVLLCVTLIEATLPRLQEIVDPCEPALGEQSSKDASLGRPPIDKTLHHGMWRHGEESADVTPGRSQCPCHLVHIQTEELAAGCGRPERGGKCRPIPPRPAPDESPHDADPDLMAYREG